MTFTGRLLLAGVGLLLVSVGWARTAPNSFLNKPASTLPSLLAQVREDPKVASRYMRHFGMTKNEVLGMFSDLELRRLNEDGVYVVYNVPNWEEVRARALYFRKGTLVWVNKQDRPILRADCGNPMIRGTDIGAAEANPSVTGSPMLHVRDLVAVSTPETAFVDMSPTVQPPGEVVLNAADVVPAPPSKPNAGPAALLILPLTAGLLTGVNNGNPPPIPEPCSMLVLGAGAAALIVRRHRRK